MTNPRRGSTARVRLLGHRPSRSTARQPTGTSTRSWWRCRLPSTWSPAPPPEVGGGRRVRTGVDTRTGWTPDGWTLDGWTGGQQPAGPRTRTTTPGDRTPDGWTPDGHRRIPDDEPGWVDAACWAPTGDRRHGWRAGRVDHGDDARPLHAAGGSAGQTPVGRATTRTARQHGLRGHARCYGRAWPPPRQSVAGGTPPSSWRLGALLSF
jgi:hypothetical protein